MSIESKTKDTLYSGKDLKLLEIWQEMHLGQNGGSIYMSLGWYTLSRNGIFSFCEWLLKVMLSDEYGSNQTKSIRINLKIHDYHVFLRCFLPLGIHRYLTRDVCMDLIELYDFSKDLCARRCYNIL